MLVSEHKGKQKACQEGDLSDNLKPRTFCAFGINMGIAEWLTQEDQA